jgi:hypothetical protein
MADGYADTGGLGGSDFRKAQRAGPLRRDGTAPAGWLRGGADVVVLSAAEESSSVGQNSQCAAVTCGASGAVPGQASASSNVPGNLLIRGLFAAHEAT